MPEYEQLIGEELEEVDVEAYIRKVKGKAVSVRRHQRGKAANRARLKAIRSLPEPKLQATIEKKRKSNTFDIDYGAASAELARRKARQSAGFGGRRAAGKRAYDTQGRHVAKQSGALHERYEKKTKLPDMSIEYLDALTTAIEDGFGNKRDLAPAKAALSKKVKARDERLRREEAERAARRAAELDAHQALITDLSDERLFEALDIKDGGKFKLTWEEVLKRSSALGTSRNQRDLFILEAATYGSTRREMEKHLPKRLRTQAESFEAAFKVERALHNQAASQFGTAYSDIGTAYSGYSDTYELRQARAKLGEFLPADRQLAKSRAQTAYRLIQNGSILADPDETIPLLFELVQHEAPDPNEQLRDMAQAFGSVAGAFAGAYSKRKAR